MDFHPEPPGRQLHTQISPRVCVHAHMCADTCVWMCVHVRVCAQSLSRVQLSATPWTVACQLLCPWDSPGKNTGVACHALLQGIFPTQGSNPGLPHCRQILYHLSRPGKPMNIGVGSLSLLQGIFPTQESTWGLLHYRRILYELSYQGSPMFRATNQQIWSKTIGKKERKQEIRIQLQ